MKTPLVSFTPEELAGRLANEYQQPKYRAEQIYKWAIKGTEIEDMTNIPKAFRQQLSEDYVSLGLEIVEKHYEKKTDTTKYLMKTNDDIVIECVALIYTEKLTVCVSSQAGCRMGCKFCMSGQKGLLRNLTAAEMLSEAILVSKDCGIPVTNIVLMGSGEPLDNYDAVRRFIKLASEDKGLNIGVRRITVSTCGLIPGVKKLTEDLPGVNLSLSLHCAVPEIRKTIMPIENAYSVVDVIEACKEYRKKSGRLITCEYTVIEGVNDTEHCARALAKLLRGTDMTVNLIDYNENPLYRKKNRRGVTEEFANKLKNLKINYTIRRKLGSDINSACGQLRASYMENSGK